MNNNNQPLIENNFYVYVLIHSDGTILYIGKGNGNRVKHLYGTSHNYFYCQFNNISFPEPKIIDCQSESQALLLEKHLIYKHQPIFNNQLKKNEPFDINELFLDKNFCDNYNFNNNNYWEEE